MTDGAGAGHGQAGHHRQDGGESHRRHQALPGRPAQQGGQMDGGHIAAAQQLAGGVVEAGLRRHQGQGAVADDDVDGEEQRDQAGGEAGGLPRGAAVRHGEEAHQHMGQAQQAQTEAQAQRQHFQRIAQRRAGQEDLRSAQRLGGGEQPRRVAAEARQHAAGQQQRAAEHQHRFDHLYPSGGQHAAQRHVKHHQRPHQAHGGQIGQAEQQFDQLARAHHLHDQIKQRHRQRVDAGGQPHPVVVEASAQHRGGGVAAAAAQFFCQQ